MIRSRLGAFGFVLGGVLAIRTFWLTFCITFGSAVCIHSWAAVPVVVYAKNCEVGAADCCSAASRTPGNA